MRSPDDRDLIGKHSERFSPSLLNDTVVDRFKTIARLFPDRIAVRDRDRSLTYAELYRLVQFLAEATAAIGANRLGPVAVLLPHEARFPGAVLGVLTAGRSCIALDADDPPERTRLIAAHASACAVLSSGALALKAGHLFPDLPVLDIERTDAERKKAEQPKADDLAYIIYTSGSTGTPKGVYQNHRGLLHDIMHCTDTQAISCEDRLALFNSPTNISGLRVGLSALLNGATLDIVNPREMKPAEIAREISDRGITIFRSVPRLFRHVVEGLGENQVLESVRLVVLGGDRVDWRDFELFRRACRPRARFGVHLGATECSTLYLEWYVDESMSWTGPLPVGRCVLDRKVVLLDESDCPVQDGEVGEFVVSGPFLALGYWQDPALTARLFSTDPVDPQVRFFKTGDLGRRRPDGLFEYVGRKDEQIKLRGHRVDPGEIESVLRQLADVKEAALVVRRNEIDLPQSLAAYIELHSSSAGLRPPDFRSMLANRFPDYMIPATFNIVDTLPRLPNLKTDRVRLKELDEARYLSNESSVLQSTGSGPLHHQIAEIWRCLIGRDDIRFDDNFFEIGGDSLSATQMICEVEAIIGQKIPQSALGTVFTVRELAATMLHRMPVSEELITCAKPGRGSPFFFCHGDYTTRGVYALRLAKMLTCDQPVYLLHPYIDFNLNHPIEEMAQVYPPGLLAAHPTGVFRLGGHCNGALLAWEIARQLERLGRKVEFMALIEAPSLNARPVFRAAALLNSSIVAVAPRKIGQKFAREGMRAAWARRGFPRNGPHSRAVTNYVPPKLTSRVVCLISEESRSKVDFSWRPWTNLAADVSCHYIAGSHLGCITKHVGDTALVLDRLFKQPQK